MVNSKQKIKDLFFVLLCWLIALALVYIVIAKFGIFVHR
jgi:hypothetical protein